MTFKSETIGDLAKALAAVQGDIKAAKKDAVNPFFKSNYADLPAVVAACKDSLSKNGIAYFQTTNFDAEGVWLETMLCHSSGEWIMGRYPIKPVKPDPQSAGSAMTYARRYALAAIVGVVAEDEDDDGAQASGNVRAESRDSKGERLKKARAWAQDAIRMINGFDPVELEKWEAKNSPFLVELRDLDPDTHELIMKAIQGK